MDNQFHCKTSLKHSFKYLHDLAGLDCVQDDEIPNFFYRL